MPDILVQIFVYCLVCMRSLFTLVATFCLGAVSSAAAQTHIEVGAGVSFTRDNEDTTAIALAWLPPWREMHGGLLRTEMGTLQFHGRGHSRYNNAQTVRLVHAGLRYEHPNGLTAGFGIGAQHGKTDALSGDPQFISTIGWRWSQFSLLFRHVSNGGFDKPNEGENFLEAAWRF